MDEPKERATASPDYLKMQEGKFKVSGDGVFFTLQGEGLTQGMPAVFLRLHICNLQCGWCDSWYTWNKKTPQFWTEANNYSTDEVSNMLESAWNAGTERKDLPIRVVVTGGEPTLQQKLIEELARKHEDWNWEIETNGTIMPSQYLLEHFQFNCSPKLENSDNKRALRIHPDVLQAINTAEKSAFKFVVMTDNDLDEIQRDFIDSGLVSIDKVILMPEGITTDQLRGHMTQVAEYAKRKGFRMLSRLQTDIWGTARRV